ncbi:MAG: chromate transporter [Paludibacterium sp.]|uniref:chromate transporter n=1 Tax=Paludibacterium sp. TaxID=1917523 RepID=UPI0025FE64DE|nr:chromate transporter [Paludibacterium sp.]MBV8048125.1 chromate transporter [Paludibacterium sp.]MBV8647003.1 chromate transporter [Paludibacterium sp.]
MKLSSSISPPPRRDDATAAIARPGCRALFLGFLQLGLSAFGGALPLAHRMLVEERRWVSADEFVELLGLCQFLPGGNVVNLAAALGARFRGVRGVLSALAGLLVVPTAISIALSAVYAHFQNNPVAQRLFDGLACAAVGLLIQMAFKLCQPVAVRPLLGGVALMCFIAIAALHWPLVWVFLIMVPLGMGASYLDRRFIGGVPEHE